MFRTLIPMALLLVGCDEASSDSNSDTEAGPAGQDDGDSVADEVLWSVAALDGTVDSQGLVDTTSTEMEIGRGDGGFGTRGFVSFDIADLVPADDQTVAVEQAVLSVYENNFNLLPWDSMGNAELDVVQYTTLDAAAFDAPTLIDAGIASSQSNFLEFHELTVTDALQAFFDDELDGQYVQFRFRFAGDSDTADPTLDDHHWDLNTAEATEPADSGPRLTLRLRYSSASE